MSTVSDLIDSYDPAGRLSDRRRIIEELGGHFPSSEALHFILRVVENSTAPEEETIRITAVQLFGWCPVETDAEKQRIVQTLTRLLRNSPSLVERVQVIGAC